jgi:hypothetical protein
MDDRTMDDRNQIPTRDAPQSRKIRVGIGHFGVQNIEVDYGKLCDQLSPWEEFLDIQGSLNSVKDTDSVLVVRLI